MRPDEAEPEDNSHLLANGAKLKDIISALVGLASQADAPKLSKMREEDEILTGQVAEMKAELQEVRSQ